MCPEMSHFGVAVLSPDRGVRASPLDFAVRLLGSIRAASQEAERGFENPDGAVKEKRY